MPLAGGDGRYPPPPLAGGVGVGVEAADDDDCIGVLCCCGVDCCCSMDCDWKGLVFSAAAGAAAAVAVGDDMLIPAKALVTDVVVDDDDVLAAAALGIGIDAARGLEAWAGWLGMPLAVGDIMDWATPPPTVPPPVAAAVAVAVVAAAPPVGAGTGVGALSRPANGSIPAADMAPKPCVCCWGWGCPNPPADAVGENMLTPPVVAVAVGAAPN